MKKRNFSRRDQKFVEDLIRDICDEVGLDCREPDYMNIGWEGFLDVYRNQRGGFWGDGNRGWYAAAKVIHEKLTREKAILDFARYGLVSLDAALSPENTETRLDRLQTRGGDFQNSVCFWDYIDDLEQRSWDAGFLARRFIEGDTPDEIRHVNHWGSARFYRAFNELREAMEGYLQIEREGEGAGI